MMFIWNSMFVMTAIDLVIIISICYLYVLFYRYRHIAKNLRLSASIAKILFGLSIIQVFYAIDLFSMLILPMFISMERAMEFMTALHLNWRWITSLGGILLIFWGLSTMFPNIDFNVKRIQNICQELDIKNRELELTLEELTTTHLQLVQNEKMASLGSLLAGVAHEINNPIGFISGNVNAAEEYFQDLLYALSLYQKEYSRSLKLEIANELERLDIEFIAKDSLNLIESMRSGTNRLENISKSLRIFSRVDSDEKIKFNLSQGIDSTLLILKYRLKANEERPEIEVIKNYNNLPKIKCYPGQLNQVFMNILANAIDALEEESDKNTPQIYLTTEAQGEMAIVQISDNGKGMSQEVKERIFEQGFTTKGVGKGTGLGMAISRQIVTEKHGGTITCTSELGKGTTFTIALPMSG